MHFHALHLLPGSEPFSASREERDVEVIVTRHQHQLIDSNLAHGNPVIVRVQLANGITHFVVVAGKDGFDYLVRDPGGGAAKGIYPLRELNSDIEALRFYQPLTNAGQHLSAQR